MKTERSQKFYQQFLETVEASAARVAYRCGSETFTYGQLMTVVKNLAPLLSNHRRIAHFTDKNFVAYPAIWATVLTNRAWVPIALHFPLARILEMLDASKVTAFLTNQVLDGELVAQLNQRKIQIILLSQTDLLLQPSPSLGHAHFDLTQRQDDDLAYIMFTSGSTGVPKGVPMTHGNFIPFIENALNIMQLRGTQGDAVPDVYADYHEFGFDISIFYLFCAPLTGSAIAPMRDEKHRTLPLQHAIENQVTVLATVPSSILRHKNLRPNDHVYTQLRILFLCGEPLRLDLLGYALDKIKPEKIYNFYGLTETGVENFYHECSSSDLSRFAEVGFVPIGRPLPENKYRIDPDNGELWVSGPAVMDGYLNASDNRMVNFANNSWFKTGDLAVEVDQKVFCKGRIDSQIKLRGYRIELMDIEANLRKIPQIDEAIVQVCETSGAEILVAAFSGNLELSSEANVVDASGIQEIPIVQRLNIMRILETWMPQYMVPSRFIKFERLPVNSSGKIDRVAIKKICQQLLVGGTSNFKAASSQIPQRV